MIRQPWYARRTFAVATAAFVVAVTLVLSLSPATRDAVADFLGLGGIRISFGPGPTPTALPGHNLALGARTTLANARRDVDFDILVPSGYLANPDAVYLSAVPPGGRVSLVYRPSALLPKTSETGVGMIVAEFQATVGDDLVKKILDSGSALETTTVGGNPAFWIEGPHTMYLYRDRTGRIRPDTLRLAGNTLVWQRDGITLRLESALDRQHARRIAESM